MNIVIIDHEPFSEIKKQHYYIEQFNSNGFDVEYWSLVDFLSYTKKLKYTYREEDSYVNYIKSKNELLERLNKLNVENTILVIEFWFTPFTLEIFKFFKSKKLKWVKIDYYLNPTIVLEPIKSLKQKLLEIRANNLYRKMTTFLFGAFFGNRSLNVPDILFVTGSNKERVPASRRIVGIDYFDIDKFIQIKEKKPPLPDQYVVFLDTMLIDHPDILMYGFKQQLNKKKYFEALNLFFTSFESQTGYNVVIASHPKANYDNEFEGRLCLKGVTAELVIHSKAVLTHGSLSISFALLSQKPIIYLFSSKLFVKNEFLSVILKNMQMASSLLNAKFIDLEGREDIVLDLVVDKEKYNSFLDLYYRRDSAETTSNFLIIKDHFISLLNDCS